MNPDLTEFYQEAPRPGVRSWYEKIRPDMDPEQGQKLDAALSEPGISHAAIANVLKAWGYKVNDAQVGHYRRTLHHRG
jgi:hypothetical protein